MFAPGSRNSQQRHRIALSLALVGLFTYSGAGAQSDKDWVETALERTLRLSAPWELPLNPQIEQNPESGEFLSPTVSPDLDLVLEVPWGNEDSSNDTSSGPHVVVRSVDQFDDPWNRSETGPVDADPEETAPENDSFEDATLIDPWSD